MADDPFNFNSGNYTGPANANAHPSVNGPGAYADASDTAYSDDNPFVMWNPQQIDLAATNPELYKELVKRRGYLNEFDSQVSQFTDPALYQQLRDQAKQGAQNQVQNQYSNIGLGGSSTAMGAGQNASRVIDLQMLDRQLSDQIKIQQMRGVMTSGVEGDITAIQNNFASYQQMQLNAYLTSIGAENANAASIWQAAGTVGGALAGAFAGGPAGAAAGAAGGSALAGTIFNGSSVNMDYNPAAQTPSLGVNTTLPAVPSFNTGYAPGYGASGYFGNDSVPFTGGY